MMTGVGEDAHVPYRGKAPMLTDLIGGQVQVALILARVYRTHKSRQAAAWQVTTASRSEACQIPTRE